MTRQQGAGPRDPGRGHHALPSQALRPKPLPSLFPGKTERSHSRLLDKHTGLHQHVCAWRLLVPWVGHFCWNCWLDCPPPRGSCLLLPQRDRDPGQWGRSRGN